MKPVKPKAVKTADGKPAKKQPPMRRAERKKAYKEAASNLFPKILPPAPDAPDTHNDTWTETLGAELFELVVMGLSLKKISYMPNMPRLSTLCRWTADQAHPFYAIYIEARATRVAVLEEEIEEIADTPEPLTKTIRRIIVTSQGETVVNETVTQDDPRHRQIKISVRQFALGHIAPKKHGKNPEQQGDDRGLKELLADMRRAHLADNTENR